MSDANEVNEVQKKERYLWGDEAIYADIEQITEAFVDWTAGIAILTVQRSYDHYAHTISADVIRVMKFFFDDPRDWSHPFGLIDDAPGGCIECYRKAVYLALPPLPPVELPPAAPPPHEVLL